MRVSLIINFANIFDVLLIGVVVNVVLQFTIHDLN